MFTGLCSVGPRRTKALPMETETLRKPCGCHDDERWLMNLRPLGNEPRHIFTDYTGKLPSLGAA